MQDCIFCKISNGEIKTEFLFEDDKCVIFKDINPKAKIHLLIVPKHHLPSISEIEEQDKNLLGHLLFCAKKIGEQLTLDGYKLQINVGESGGQEIFHIHVHLMAN